jgi:hypothetical protein
MSALGQKQTCAQRTSQCPLSANSGHHAVVCRIKRGPRVPLAGPQEDDGKCAPCLSYPPPARRSRGESADVAIARLKFDLSS